MKIIQYVFIYCKNSCLKYVFCCFYRIVSVVSKFLTCAPIFALFIIDLFSLAIIYIMYIKRCKTHTDIKNIVNESKMEPQGIISAGRDHTVNAFLMICQTTAKCY